MPASKGGRTLQDWYDTLGTSVKRKRNENELSTAKRQCILQEQLPLIMSRRVVKKDDNTKRRGDLKDRNEESSGKPDTETGDLIEYIKEQRKLVERDTEELEAKKRTFFQKQSDLVGVYMYGLETISKLTDVREAPDAILPGNQV